MQVLFAGYRAYLVAERGLAPSTVRNYLSVAQQFVSNRDGSGQADLGGMTAAEVSEFMLASCRDRSVGSATILVVGLRALLRYLHLTGVTPMGLAGAVPSAACWPATTLPRPVRPGEAKRLLRSCDQRTAVGRRDFAIITLMVRLGLRVGEIAALELGDVDWRRGEIMIRGKGRREERLPLSADVGEAMAGWLRRGRPPGRVAARACSPRCSPRVGRCAVRRLPRSCAAPVPAPMCPCRRIGCGTRLQAICCGPAPACPRWARFCAMPAS